MKKGKKNANKGITGLHVLGEVFTKESRRLKNLRKLSNFLSTVISENKVSRLGECEYKFSGGGFSTIINLAESHIWGYYFDISDINKIPLVIGRVLKLAR